MMETPRGILQALEIADHPRVQCLVMGTSDLTKDLHALHTGMRLPMLPSLGLCLLAARAAGAIVDGVYLDLNDGGGFAASCQQGRELGFDGRTLIHPKQIEAANEAFGPSADAVTYARKIIAAFEEARAAGKGVVVVDGKLVENLTSPRPSGSWRWRTPSPPASLDPDQARKQEHGSRVAGQGRRRHWRQHRHRARGGARAGRGRCHLVLAARDAGRLGEAAAAVRDRHGTRAIGVPCVAAEGTAPRRSRRTGLRRGRHLVNNAGTGSNETIMEAPDGSGSTTGTCT